MNIALVDHKRSEDHGDHTSFAILLATAREPIAIVAGSRITWNNAVWKLEIRLGSDSLGAPSHRMLPRAVSSISRKSWQLACAGRELTRKRA